MHAARDVRLVIDAEQVALCGDLQTIGRHRHASAAVVVGLDGPIRIVAERVHATRACILAPGFGHAVDVRGRLAVFLLPVHALSGADVPPLRDVAAPPWLELAGAVARDELAGFDLVERLVRRSAPQHRPIDDRLRRGLSSITDALEENLPVDVIADAAGLSPSRLMALVRAQLGTSLRGYRRWLRTFAVARAYASGGSLTSAALDAGFASSSHLVTAARAQFGIRPSQILSPANRPAIRAVG